MSCFIHVGLATQFSNTKYLMQKLDKNLTENLNWPIKASGKSLFETNLDLINLFKNRKIYWIFDKHKVKDFHPDIHL